MPIRSPQGSLSRLEKEHPAATHLVRFSQLVDGSWALAESREKYGVKPGPKWPMPAKGGH